MLEPERKAKKLNNAATLRAKIYCNLLFDLGLIL